MKLLQIALRLAWRDKAKFIFVVIANSFTAFLVFISFSFILSIRASFADYIDGFGGDFWVFPKGYTNINIPAVLSLKDVELVKEIAGVDQIYLVDSQRSFASDGVGYLPIVLVGIEVTNNNKMQSADSYFGNIAAGLGNKEVVISQIIARRLSLKAGDMLRVQERPYRIKEVVRAKDVAQNFAFVLFEDLPYRSSQDKAQYAVVDLGDDYDVNLFSERLPPGLQLVTRDEVVGSMLQVQLLDMGSSILMIWGISLVVSLALVFNSVFTEVVELLKVYATLKAAGIGWLKMAYTLFWQSLFSLLPGAVMGYALNLVLGRVFFVGIFSSWSSPLILLPLVVGLFLLGAVVAVVIPSLRLRKLDPMSIFNY